MRLTDYEEAMLAGEIGERVARFSHAKLRLVAFLMWRISPKWRRRTLW